MSIELRKEQNDYIDKILSKGLIEIKTVPSYDLNTISNNSNTIQSDDIKNNFGNNNKLNLKIPTINDFNISNDIYKGIFLNKNIEEEKNEIFYNSMNEKNKNNFNNSLNINLLQKNIGIKEENKENNFNLIMSNNFPNKNEIINNALKNNHKNINKLNKYIRGNTLSSSHSNYNNNYHYYKKGDLSSSTKNLIDKYLDMKSSNYSKRSSKLNKNDSLFNELDDNVNNDNMMNIHDLSCSNNNINENDNENIRNKKYNPKSSALKILIEKLKKEDEYEESKNNNNSIQISSLCDSGLFTLGNSNEISSIKNDKYYKKIIKKNKKRLKSEIIKKKNIRTFDKITNSSSKFNKTNSEIDIFKNRIKNRASYGNKNIIVPLIKKNYSMKSLLKPNMSKNQLFKISSTSMGNISMIKNKKARSKSMYIIKEENEYNTKYKKLRKKFENQREKMKEEKNNIIALQQRIKFFKKKLETYPDLVEFNKTLNKQNNILINNLNCSDDVRKKQAKLIILLQNQLKKLKKI